MINKIPTSRLSLIAVLIFGLSNILFAQSLGRFENFHGLSQPQTGDQYFEGEGYDIVIKRLVYKLDDKGMTKLKRQYGFKEINPNIDSTLNVRVFRRQEEQSGVTGYFSLYLLPSSNSVTTVIGFVRAGSQDIELERFFVKASLSQSIPYEIFTSSEISDIDFVGRTITLGSACHWMSPHNIQCPNLGQMNWAIFDDLKSAEVFRDSRLTATKNKELLNLKEEKWITVKFEGTEVKALRTKLKVQMPKLVMGGSNVLIAYYVTAQVRGNYVTCILSHYTDDVGADKLPPLLSEVMELIEP